MAVFPGPLQYAPGQGTAPRRIPYLVLNGEFAGRAGDLTFHQCVRAPLKPVRTVAARPLGQALGLKGTQKGIVGQGQENAGKFHALFHGAPKSRRPARIGRRCTIGKLLDRGAKSPPLARGDHNGGIGNLSRSQAGP